MDATLFERLGGAEGVRSIVEDVVARHLQNPVVKTRFENVADLDHAKQMAYEFFAAGAGGPVHYSGREMRVAHRGMNISEQEYLAVMDDIMAALRDHAIDDTTQKDVLAILYSLKEEIIRM